MDSSFIQYPHENSRKRLEKNNVEFYQQPEFVTLDAELIEGKPLAWYAEDGSDWMHTPLIERRIPDEITNGKEYHDLLSPYGYPGMLFSSYRGLNKFLKKYKEDAAEEGYISTFIRLNPVYNPLLLNESDNFVQVVHGKLVLLNMDEPYEVQRMKYSSNHRRDIKKLLKSDHTLEWNSWENLDTFLDIYTETMKREEASDYFFFSDTYFHRLKKILGPSGIDLVFVKNNEGEAVAGGIFCKNDYVIQFHLGGTKTEYLKRAPSKLLFDGMIKKYSEKVAYFNLGGGVGNEQDSLFKFKEGFGKEYRKFSTLRIVNDRQRYNNLCQSYPKEDLYNLEDYFPLYRK